MDPAEAFQLEVELGQVFSPAAPIDTLKLFAGRRDQRSAVIDVVLQKGRHGILFGERGVGKTSLSSVIQSTLEQAGQSVIAVRVNCDETDSFNSVWRKVFAKMDYVVEQRRIGFSTAPSSSVHRFSDDLPKGAVTPDTVCQILQIASANIILIIVLDEFDRLRRPLEAAFSDTIKALSDYAIPATLLLVGVGESVEELIHNHQSVERALAQIRVPRMSSDELSDIIDAGLTEVGMKISPDVRDRIVVLSRGLPHYTHLVALDSSRNAARELRLEVTNADVDAGIKKAVENAQESIKATHHQAVMSPRENLYREVALACALARTDERGYFTAGSVRAPMSAIMGKPYDIPAFARHMSDFSDNRGPLLTRIGSERNYHYIFRNPLMQPYIIMDGIASGLIAAAKVAELERRG